MPCGNKGTIVIYVPDGSRWRIWGNNGPQCTLVRKKTNEPIEFKRRVRCGDCQTVNASNFLVRQNILVVGTQYSGQVLRKYKNGNLKIRTNCGSVLSSIGPEQLE